jgi:predicted metal-binding protein
LGMAMKLSGIKPDVIHLSSCMADAKPGCPYTSPQEMADILKKNTGIEVILGTHDYH